MRTNLRKLCATVALLCAACGVQAQEQVTVGRQLVSPPRDFFVPHWEIGLQGGAAYDVGEAKFFDLLSPAAQLSAGYQFTELIGARLAVSGAWAKNRYAYPLAKYSWNFVQPSLDVKIDLASLLLGWVPDQPVSTYAFVGAGVAYSFNNDDAVKADQRFGIDFHKLWDGHRWNPVVRAGLGADIRLTDVVALTAEANANMLPDHFNSKRGRSDNRDWHFNALVGVKVNLSRNRGQLEARYRDIVQQMAPQPDPVRTQDADSIAFTEYVQFKINSSDIRSSEYQKIIRVLQYLRSHPHSHVELTGFADKETGTPSINDRLSRERAVAVTNFLVARGIDRSRISAYAKGDRVQPFQIPEDNRVTICIVIEEGLKQVIK